MFVFHTWLTASLPIKESKLISGLVNKGYDVSAAASTNDLTLLPSPNASYGIIACKIQRELGSAKELYEDIIDILTVHKFTYYSLIISEYAEASMWNAGNSVNNDSLSLLDNKPTKKNFN